MTRAYLLLDSNQIPDLYARLFQSAPKAIPHALYLTTRYADLASVGPVLIAVEPNGLLAKTFTEEWQASAGIWLETEAGEADLIAHLRSLVHVQLEGNVSAFFRFYDPRITRLWLADLTDTHRDRLMGPVRSIRLPDGAYIHQINADQPCGQYAATPWLTLSALQLEQLCQGKRDQFNQRMLDHCQRYFPQCLQGLDAQARQQWAQDCQRNAARLGYSAEDEVMCWISLYAHFGAAFPEGPGQEVYRQLLAGRDVTPQQRLDHLLDELTRQFITGEVAA